MVRERKQYSREFKAQAVQQAEDSGLSYREIARALGIQPGTLYRWREEIVQQVSPQDSPGAEISPASIHQLQRQVQVLEEECAILKKALAIFSKPGR
jgi:transposase